MIAYGSFVPFTTIPKYPTEGIKPFPRYIEIGGSLMQQRQRRNRSRYRPNFNIIGCFALLHAIRSGIEGTVAKSVVDLKTAQR